MWEADIVNSVHTLIKIFLNKGKTRIFTFLIVIYIWNNNPLYYEETLVFTKLFGAIKRDVYCNILKEMCLIFVHDHKHKHTRTVYFTTLLYYSGGKISYGSLTSREMFWILSRERKLLNIHMFTNIIFEYYLF